MVSKVNSIGLEGLDGYVIEVETDTRPGNETKTDVVGLPDASVKEAMNRVRSAIYNNRFRIPDCNIITNLAPASIKKEGCIKHDKFGNALTTEYFHHLVTFKIPYQTS